MALEAALPAIIYEEFTAAVARAEEARDEIPSHPDDVETPEEHEAEQAAQAQEAAPAAQAEEEPAELAEASPEASGDGEEHEHWEHHKRAHSDGGGVISVPEAATPAPVEVVGSEDALEELPQRHKRRWRHYKIQEVIKRHQIILVQVVKEERGNKGAALTTYLSLAGRYCVLMPNTPRGGGISRKITIAADRKRLKKSRRNSNCRRAWALIIRTAGESRTKVEIKRDYEYLLRMWDNVRELTLKSNAPASSTRKATSSSAPSAIFTTRTREDPGRRRRRLSQRQGLHAHAHAEPCEKREANTRSRSRSSTHIRGRAQLDAMFCPVGHAEIRRLYRHQPDRGARRHRRELGPRHARTFDRGHGLKTNLEAAEEVARQLRLRDLAGLIVIDFIDMEDGATTAMWNAG